MDYRLFVKSTVCSMDKSIFEKCKGQLIENGITFAVIEPEQVTEAVLAEKLCDYFETLTIKTGKLFEKRMEIYMNDIDSIVASHIEKAPQVKKGDKSPIIIPRARKYYDKAMENKGVKNLKFEQLTDYSRLMFCLYTEILSNKGESIDDFNFSAECLNPGEILTAMKKEETAAVIPHQKKKRFDTKEKYGSDTATMIISILMLWSIINASVQGDGDHE